MIKYTYNEKTNILQFTSFPDHLRGKEELNKKAIDGKVYSIASQFNPAYSVSPEALFLPGKHAYLDTNPVSISGEKWKIYKTLIDEISILQKIILKEISRDDKNVRCQFVSFPYFMRGKLRKTIRISNIAYSIDSEHYPEYISSFRKLYTPGEDEEKDNILLDIPLKHYDNFQLFITGININLGFKEGIEL